MDGCKGLFKVLQYLRIRLRRWPREKLGPHSSISRGSHLPGAFEASHRELLILAGQQPVGTYEGVEIGICGVDCHVPAGRGGQNRDREGSIVVAIVGLGSRCGKREKLKLGPIGRKL